MKLNELAPNQSRKARKRIGRGTATGQGKTAGKGNNGQKSRSGSYIHFGFEGGQMPLIKRVPKRGFSNHKFKKDIAIVNLSTLEERFADGSVINIEALLETGAVKQAKDGVKILANGELTKKFTVEGCVVSATAKTKIEAAGGTVEKVEEKVKNLSLRKAN